MVTTACPDDMGLGDDDRGKGDEQQSDGEEESSSRGVFRLIGGGGKGDGFDGDGGSRSWPIENPAMCIPLATPDVMERPDPRMTATFDRRLIGCRCRWCRAATALGRRRAPR